MEPGRDGGALDRRAVRGLEAAVGPAVRLDAGVVRVLAAQDRRARRAAQRDAVEVVVERDAVVADQRGGVRHVREVTDVQVVGQHEQDVRPGTMGCRRTYSLLGAARGCAARDEYRDAHAGGRGCDETSRCLHDGDPDSQTLGISEPGRRKMRDPLSESSDLPLGSIDTTGPNLAKYGRLETTGW